MTVTLTGTWAQTQLTDAREGRKIGKGHRDDPQTLNRALIQEFACDGATALAQMSIMNGLTTYGAGYSTIAQAKVRVWGDGARINFHVYCAYTRVRVTLGGVVLGAATNGAVAPAWASMGAVTLSGATFDAEGMVTVLVEAQDNVGVGTFYHIVISEEAVVAGSLPGPSSTQTGFRAMHDELYATADGSVDICALQKLDDNIEQLFFERARRACVLYPVQGSTQQIRRMSSVYWRLEGPYIMQVPFYADGLTVTITAANGAVPAADLEIFALTEYESFDAVYADRKQTVTAGSGTQYLKFQGLKCAGGSPCMVWIAFRSAIVSATTTTIAAYSWMSSTPQTLYCERNATLEAASTTPDNVTWGYCLTVDAEDVAASKNAAIKNATGYNTPSQLFDIATVQGIDNSGGGAADKALLLTISPHPGTGITRGMNAGGIVKWWTATASDTVDAPSMIVRRCAIGFLYAVDIQCVKSLVAPTARKIVQVAGAPSAGLLAEIATRVNQMTFVGNSQVMIRHSGAGCILSNTFISGKPIYYAGAYMFGEGSGAGTTGSYIQTVPIAQPNVASGLGSLTLWAQFIFMATYGGGLFPTEGAARYRVRLGSSDWVESETPMVRRPTHGAQESPTVADALAAMTSTAVEVNSSPQETTANSYGQCVTWPSEGSRRAMPWVYSVPFSDDSQPSFPALLNAEFEPFGGSKYNVAVQVVIAGLHVWWGPREA